MYCLMIINVDNNADITSVSMCRERWVTLLFPQSVFVRVWLPRPAHGFRFLPVFPESNLSVS